MKESTYIEHFNMVDKSAFQLKDSNNVQKIHVKRKEITVFKKVSKTHKKMNKMGNK